MTRYAASATKLAHSERVMVAGAISGRPRQSRTLMSTTQLKRMRTARMDARVVAELEVGSFHFASKRRVHAAMDHPTTPLDASRDTGHELCGRKRRFDHEPTVGQDGKHDGSWRGGEPATSDAAPNMSARTACPLASAGIPRC